MLDFTGEGVVVSDEGSGRAQVQIDGATPLVLFDEGNRLSSDLASVNFVVQASQLLQWAMMLLSQSQVGLTLLS